MRGSSGRPARESAVGLGQADDLGQRLELLGVAGDRIEQQMIGAQPDQRLELLADLLRCAEHTGRRRPGGVVIDLAEPALELGLGEAVLDQRIRPTFDQHVGWAFEEAARQHFARLARAGRLGFLPQRIGGWWDRAAEVDVVAISDGDGAMLLGECKWSRNPVGPATVDALKRKAALTVIDTLFRRIPGLRLAVPLRDVRFKHDMGLYGVYQLPVTW